MFLFMSETRKIWKSKHGYLTRGIIFFFFFWRSSFLAKSSGNNLSNTWLATLFRNWIESACFPPIVSELRHRLERSLLCKGFLICFTLLDVVNSAQMFAKCLLCMEQVRISCKSFFFFFPILNNRICQLSRCPWRKKGIYKHSHTRPYSLCNLTFDPHWSSHAHLLTPFPNSFWSPRVMMWIQLSHVRSTKGRMGFLRSLEGLFSYLIVWPFPCEIDTE